MIIIIIIIFFNNSNNNYNINNNNNNNNSNISLSPPYYKNVVNLSFSNFDPCIFSLLNKGLNFVISPEKVPIDDIICNIEYGIRDFPHNVKEVMRQDCAIGLKKVKPPKINLSRDELLALKSPRENTDIVLLKADKGGAIVILDKSDYVNKMIDHLSNSGCYVKLKKNPLKYVPKVVAATIKSNLSLSPLSRKLIESNPLTPRIYGLPKIHKFGAPLRPIVNTISGPTCFLAKFLALKLKPLVGRTDSFVKDSGSFVKELKDVKSDPRDLLVSFDVVSLYTQIPIQEAIYVISQITDHDTTKLVGLCLTLTFFSFQGEFYEQTYDVAMGSPLSPIVANLFMEDCETKALASMQFRPKKWKSFVDDTCIIWPRGLEKLDMFLNHLNSQFESIKFMMEGEVDECLPFLDILLSRIMDDGSISHKVFSQKKLTWNNIFMLVLIIFLLRNLVFSAPLLPVR